MYTRAPPVTARKFSCQLTGHHTRWLTRSRAAARRTWGTHTPVACVAGRRNRSVFHRMHAYTAASYCCCAAAAVFVVECRRSALQQCPQAPLLLALRFNPLAVPAR